jgi:hypothetical protein
MNCFPLYDNLLQELPNKELTQRQKQDIIKNILSVNLNGLELIYSLIHFYYIQNEKDSVISELPYNGIKVKNDNNTYNVTWDIDLFPTKLKQLLHKFISIHLKSIGENPDRL